jgi:hypothetical protein
LSKSNAWIFPGKLECGFRPASMNPVLSKHEVRLSGVPCGKVRL